MLFQEYTIVSDRLSDHRIGFVDGRLKMLQVSFNFDNYMKLDRSQALQLEKELDELILGFNVAHGSGINKGFQVAGNTWAWLELRGAVVSDAMQSIFYSIVLSFIILLLTTGNFYISLLSIISISFIIL